MPRSAPSGTAPAQTAMRHRRHRSASARSPRTGRTAARTIGEPPESSLASVSPPKWAGREISSAPDRVLGGARRERSLPMECPHASALPEGWGGGMAMRTPRRCLGCFQEPRLNARPLAVEVIVQVSRAPRCDPTSPSRRAKRAATAASATDAPTPRMRHRDVSPSSGESVATSVTATPATNTTAAAPTPCQALVPGPLGQRSQTRSAHRPMLREARGRPHPGSR